MARSGKRVKDGRNPAFKLEHVLRHVGLALVHVLDERLQVLKVDVVEDDDGLLVVHVGVAEERLQRDKQKCLDINSDISEFS